jgi:hypothetical protein
VSPIAGDDPEWLDCYEDRKGDFLFWFTDQQLAEWYGGNTPLDEIAPRDRNGYIRAVWRNERTASVWIYEDNTWVDFGAGGVMPDGTQDKGDAVELRCRVAGIEKSEVMRQVARQLIREAQDELDLAAYEGRNPVRWVFEITSPTGWAHYDQIRNSSAEYLGATGKIRNGATGHDHSALGQQIAVVATSTKAVHELHTRSISTGEPGPPYERISTW